jgi:hypothetical protein
MNKAIAKLKALKPKQPEPLDPNEIFKQFTRHLKPGDGWVVKDVAHLQKVYSLPYKVENEHVSDQEPKRPNPDEIDSVEGEHSERQAKTSAKHALEESAAQDDDEEETPAKRQRRDADDSDFEDEESLDDEDEDEDVDSVGESEIDAVEVKRYRPKRLRKKNGQVVEPDPESEEELGQFEGTGVPLGSDHFEIGDEHVRNYDYLSGQWEQDIVSAFP